MSVPPGRFLEVLRPREDRGSIAAALFDFDGTVSLIRQGWQDVMVPFLAEIFVEAGVPGEPAELQALARDFVSKTTGVQTILQMRGAVEIIRSRGGSPRDPKNYKTEYLRRLRKRISGRLESLEKGGLSPERFLVPGVLEFLSGLRRRGVRLFCASGTDEPDVRREAALLGVADLFDGGVFGAGEDAGTFSKKDVIGRILKEGGLGGPELLVAGDGFVEMEEGRAAGAHTLGIASKEEALLEGLASPGPDEWKRKRLAEAGADLVVPDFSEWKTLLAYFFPGR